MNRNKYLRILLITGLISSTGLLWYETTKEKNHKQEPTAITITKEQKQEQTLEEKLSPVETKKLESLIESAKSYEKNKLNFDAIEIYRTIVKDFHENKSAIEAQQNIIRIYSEEFKLPEKAAEECEILIKLLPDTKQAAHTRLLKGQIYYKAKMHYKAISEYTRFIEDYTGEYDINTPKFLMATNYLAIEEGDQARRVLREIIEKNINSDIDKEYEFVGTAQFLIGYSYLTEQQYKEALEEFERVIDSFPESKHGKEAQRFADRLRRVQNMRHIKKRVIKN